MVGFADAPVTFDPIELVVHDVSITGSLIGSRTAMREMLTFAQEHSITPMIEPMPMPRVNDAIQKVKENKARYRIVLLNAD